MPEPAKPETPPKPRRRWLPRLRFSLRTLLFFVLLIGSATTLWLHWEPWYRVSTLTHKFLRHISFAAFTADCKRVIWIDDESVIHITDAQTGLDILTQPLPPARIQLESVLDGRPILLTAGKADTENESPAPPPESLY